MAVQDEPKRNPVGRPQAWTDVKVVEKIIDQYFKNQTKPTMSGLAEALDISRSSLYNYAEKDAFLDTIKKARQRIELIYEEMLIYNNAPTGVIFALKNTGWKDRTDVTTNDQTLPTPIYNGQSTKSE